jgi:hypothetical protein
MQTTIIKQKHAKDTVEKDRLTYNSISERKSTVTIQGKQSLIEGFTPHQQADFDKGITIENYAKNRGIIL